MVNLTISIFGNKIFLEVLIELKFFSKYNVKYYDDLNLCMKNASNPNQLVVFFITESNKKNFQKINLINFPLIMITKDSTLKDLISAEFVERLNTPFSIIEFEKKIVSLSSRFLFKKSSLIALNDYIIDKNERKIKKNNLELQLTEKEIDFLILFTQHNVPLSRDFFLKNVWNYSTESDTHTIETHIHRLRKKIFEKFNDNNFIKNNNKGYYI